MKGSERAKLRAMANTLEPIVHIGKDGITENLVKQVDDALTARELIKGKALETAPESAREAAETIAAAVGAEVVQVIGRVFVLYRRNDEEPKIVLPKGRN